MLFSVQELMTAEQRGKLRQINEKQAQEEGKFKKATGDDTSKEK